MTDHSKAFRLGLLTLIMTFVVVGGAVALSGSAAADNIGGFNADDNGYNNSVAAGASNQAVGELVINPQSTGSGVIDLPDGITISDSSSPTVLASNYSDVSLTVNSDRDRLSVGYTLEGDGNYINISNIRVDVDAGQLGSDTATTGLAQADFNVVTTNVTANTTVDKVRGQNGVGVHNITLTNNTISGFNYTNKGEFNKSLIGSGEEVEIAIPDGYDNISFDTSSTVKVYSNLKPSAVNNGSEATVTSDAITFTPTGNLTTVNTSSTQTFEKINVTGISYDTTGVTDEAVSAEFVSNLTVTTRAENPVSPVEIEAINDPGSEVVNVEAPNASLNRTVNLTSGINNDTRFNVTIEDGTTAGGAITNGDDAPIRIQIPNEVSGVSFNTSDSAPPIELRHNGSAAPNIDNTTDSNTNSDLAAGPDEITVFPNNATNTNDLFNITNITLDVAPGATNQTFNLSVVSTAANGSDSIQQNTSIGTSINATNTISLANGNTVAGDVNASVSGLTYGATGSSEATNSSGDLRPGDSIESAIEVTDRFGGTPSGITVDLNTTDNPSSQDILSTDSVTTNATGEALFDVTLGGQSGTYNVTASLAHNESANVTLEYEASPGDPTDVSVTGEANALVDDSGLGSTEDNLEQGVFKVQLVDDNGNPANLSGGTTASFDLETSGKLVNATYNLTGQQSSVDTTSDIQVGSSAISGASDSVTYDPTAITDGDPAEFFVVVRQTSTGQADLSVDVADLSDSGSITIYDDPASVELSFDKQSPTAGGTVNVTGVASTSSGDTIDIAGINASFETTDRTVSYFRSDKQDNFTAANGEVSSQARIRTEGDTAYNVTFKDSVGDAFSDVTGSSTLGAEPEPEPGQVALENINLNPDTVTNGSTNDHTLTFDATEVSDDDNTDSFTVTIPSAATLESANSVSVTDANGDQVSLSGGPSVSGNEITFDVAPDSSADTRDLSVTADVTVSVPDVSSETTEQIDIQVSDSNNGQASTSADLTITVEAAGGDGNFADEDFNQAQFDAVFGADGDQTQDELSSAINTWFNSDDGTVGDVEISQDELSSLINYWFNEL